MAACNACKTSLADVGLSETPNNLTGFLLGIGAQEKGGQKVNSPISLRYESPSVMIYDDLFPANPIHWNAIPTVEHIPDWRTLLDNPHHGARVLQQVASYSWHVVVWITSSTGRGPLRVSHTLSYFSHLSYLSKCCGRSAVML